MNGLFFWGIGGALFRESVNGGTPIPIATPGDGPAVSDGTNVYFWDGTVSLMTAPVAGGISVVFLNGGYELGGVDQWLVVDDASVYARTAQGIVKIPKAARTNGTGPAYAGGFCMNSTVQTAGGSKAMCPAKTGWVATAMPTPPSGLDGLPDNELLPPYAINDILTNRYTSGAPGVAGDYFQVDMGAIAMVSGIVVTETTLTDMAEGYTVQVSTDGTAWTTVASCVFAASTVEVINWAAMPARYVRYTNTVNFADTTSWFSINEFDITCD